MLVANDAGNPEPSEDAPEQAGQNLLEVQQPDSADTEQVSDEEEAIREEEESGGRHRKFWTYVVPRSQRRPLENLSDQLNLDTGDTRAKRSSFWVMLTLSGVIAVAGVMSDSTATVIGAMIIAPLAIPILGMGLGIVTGNLSAIYRSFSYIGISVAIVVAMGALAVIVMPGTETVLQSSQVTGRTSPGVLDLTAAFATGFAGSIARARKDLGDVLPGIAIAISLVPPLGVVGVCVGSGAWGLALGASLLFISNVVALVIASTVVFLWVGYPKDAKTARPFGRGRRAYRLMAFAAIFVAIPMGANTLLTAYKDFLVQEIRSETTEWLADTPGAYVEDVEWAGTDIIITILAPETLPPSDELVDDVQDIVPLELPVTIEHSIGERTKTGDFGILSE